MKRWRGQKGLNEWPGPPCPRATVLSRALKRGRKSPEVTDGLRQSGIHLVEGGYLKLMHGVH